MATGSSKRRKRREKRAAAARADGGGADDQSGGFGCLELGTPVANVDEVAARARLRRFLRDRRDYPERWLVDGNSFFEDRYESFCRGEYDCEDLEA